MDFVQSGVDIYQFCSSAAQTYKNYKKIGNIVGAKQARAWWIKKITGLRPLGRASSAKTWTTRFKNNLTNQTSPFHTQWKGIVEDAKGINGKGAMGAFLGGVLIDGVANWYSNKEEQALSNGTMSDERVAAETITETAIGTVMGYGSEIIIGAAVTAAWASDMILDTGEDIINSVGNAVTAFAQ